MYIATSDELEDHGDDASLAPTRILSMRVPPPRSTPPQEVSLASNGELLKASSQSAEMRSLRNELGMATAELMERELELKDSQQKLR